VEAIELKLKQASAVLGVAPKDLQNLVQFKVLRPIRRDSFYWFDNRLLLEAKVALYLKESLGTSTEVLVLFTRALSNLKCQGAARNGANFGAISECQEATGSGALTNLDGAEARRRQRRRPPLAGTR
jgi:hypothetical protein